MTSTRNTTPKPLSYEDYFLDPRILMRSVLDAANLINLRWFLYDQARREAWLGRGADHSAAVEPRAADSVGTGERRAIKRRAADDGQPAPVYAGDQRRGKDRRDRAA